MALQSSRKPASCSGAAGTHQLHSTRNQACSDARYNHWPLVAPGVYYTVPSSHRSLSSPRLETNETAPQPANPAPVPWQGGALPSRRLQVEAAIGASVRPSCSFALSEMGLRPRFKQRAGIRAARCRHTLGAIGELPARAMSRLPASHPFQSSGGCHPASTHLSRARTSMGRLSSRACTVARPVAVRPAMRFPESTHEKCSAQAWSRGLNKATIWPLAGSSAVVRWLL